MKYIISEEELDLLKEVLLSKDEHNLYKYIAFLKSKQPVELIEEARMTVDENNKPKLYTVHPNDKWKSDWEQFGSLYKIYVQKVSK